jgi:hypothetical protein
MYAELSNVQKTLVKDQMLLLVESMLNRELVNVTGWLGVQTVNGVVNSIICENGSGTCYNMHFVSGDHIFVNLAEGISVTRSLIKSWVQHID